MKRITIIIRKYFKEHPSCIKAGILAAAAVICAAALYVSDNPGTVKKNEKGETVLKREQGEEQTIHEMQVKIGESGEDRKIEIPVSGKKYSTEEIRELFSDAGEELESLILGENESLDEVRYDLDLISEIPGTGIQAAWETDDYDVIDIQGHIGSDGLSDTGTRVRLTARLSYGEEQAVHEFYVCVFPPLLSLSKNSEMLRSSQAAHSLFTRRTFSAPHGCARSLSSIPVSVRISVRISAAPHTALLMRSRSHSAKNARNLSAVSSSNAAYFSQAAQNVPFGSLRRIFASSRPSDSP